MTILKLNQLMNTLESVAVSKTADRSSLSRQEVTFRQTSSLQAHGQQQKTKTLRSTTQILLVTSQDALCYVVR